MDAFTIAKSWLDINRFNDASDSDGLLWAENIRIAALISGKGWKEFSSAPKWITWDEIDKGFLGMVPKRMIGGFSSTRDQETVHTLLTSLIIEQVEIFSMRYDSEMELTFSEENIRPFDEVSYIGPIACINLHAPDSVIIEDFKKWLTESRKQFNTQPFEKKRSDRLAVLKENQVLPFIWLNSWMVKTGHKLTQAQQAHILFPAIDDRYIDIDPTEKLRKRTIPLANEYINQSQDNDVRPNFRAIYALRFFRINGNL